MRQAMYDPALGYHEMRDELDKGGPVREEIEKLGKQLADLMSRQWSPSGQQAAGEALLTVTASVAPLLREGLDTASIMYVIGAAGCHLIPVKPADPRDAS